MTGREERFARLHIFARFARIGSNFEGAVKGDMAIFEADVFLQDDRVGTFRQICTGQNAQRVAVWHFAVKRLPGRRTTLAQRYAMNTLCVLRAGQRIAIYCAIRMRWMGPLGHRRLCQDPIKRVRNWQNLCFGDA